MTSQEPKKRGRPKKVVEAQKEENPDCQPATRGYVKCLLRKTRLNDIIDCLYHRRTSIALLGVMWLMILTMLLVARWIVPQAYSDPNITAIMLICLFMGFDKLVTSAVYTDTIEHVKRSEPSGHIQKYTPPTPVCEKRKERE